jgi:hypothetical protein
VQPAVLDKEAQVADKWRPVETIFDSHDGKKVCLRIGVACINRDGSINVRLDAVPVNGTLYIPAEGEVSGKKEKS